jgi:hypothetical protein
VRIEQLLKFVENFISSHHRFFMASTVSLLYLLLLSLTFSFHFVDGTTENIHHGDDDVLSSSSSFEACFIGAPPHIPSISNDLVMPIIDDDHGGAISTAELLDVLRKQSHDNRRRSKQLHSFVMIGKQWLNKRGDVRLPYQRRCNKQPPGASMSIENGLSCQVDTLAKHCVEDELEARGFMQKVANHSDLLWLRIGLPDLESGVYPLEWFHELERGRQRINRFPAIAEELNKKDSIALNIRRMQQRFGSEHFDFHPESFVLRLDDDRQRLLQIMHDEPRSLFILKPVYGGQG